MLEIQTQAKQQWTKKKERKNNHVINIDLKNVVRTIFRKTKNIAFLK